LAQTLTCFAENNTEGERRTGTVFFDSAIHLKKAWGLRVPFLLQIFKKPK